MAAHKRRKGAAAAAAAPAITPAPTQ
jgi:hypothetical protein